jgi:hypothetical protein
MDSPPGPDDTTIAADHNTTAQMRARLGPAQTINFDSGYQIWRYTYPPARNGEQPAEFTILFGPDGVARKARLREPTLETGPKP